MSASLVAKRSLRFRRGRAWFDLVTIRKKSQRDAGAPSKLDKFKQQTGKCREPIKTPARAAPGRQFIAIL